VADAARRMPRVPAQRSARRSTPPARGVVLLRAVSGDPPLEAYVYLPRTLAPQARIIAIVHGISELPRQYLECFAPFAERHGAVLVAPHFSRPRFRDYQRLGRSGRGARADQALERLVEEVARETHARAGRVFLFGYSGGGQFVHRYVMAHPQRVAAAVVGSAGWYTFPDAGRRYPRGICTRGDRRFDREEIVRFLTKMTSNRGSPD